jgi:subtilase family serine protease
VDEATPSYAKGENTVLCPEPDCAEVILLSDFNDHLDLHTAATLSFDETTGKYHSQRPTDIDIDMRASNSTTNNMTMATLNEPSLLGKNFNAALPPGARRHEDDARKLKKKYRGRGNSTGSEKSTLARSIAAFNPFSRKPVKAPNSTVRLGVCITPAHLPIHVLVAHRLPEN